MHISKLYLKVYSLYFCCEINFKTPINIKQYYNLTFNLNNMQINMLSAYNLENTGENFFVLHRIKDDYFPPNFQLTTSHLSLHYMIKRLRIQISQSIKFKKRYHDRCNDYSNMIKLVEDIFKTDEVVFNRNCLKYVIRIYKQKKYNLEKTIINNHKNMILKTHNLYESFIKLLKNNGMVELN